MATKDRKDIVNPNDSPSYRADRLDQSRKRDYEYHKSIFHPTTGSDWKCTKSTVTSMRDFYRNISTTQKEESRWHITFDHKLNKDEMIPVPYRSVPGDTYKRFVTRMRSINNMWHYKDIDADTYHRLVRYMKSKKIRIGDSKRTLADMFLDE